MHLADTYALATILPVLAIDFSVSPIRLKYALTVYLFVSAVMIPVSGWLADRWGGRRVFLFSMAIFLVGSLLCALSDSAVQLTLARVFQGLGGGVMVPVARLIVVRSCTRLELVKTLNWFTIPAIMGPLLGPVLAGFLAEFYSWRWVFLINIPIGLVGSVLVLRYVAPGSQTPPGKLDRFGAAVVGLSILGVMIVADTAGTGIIPGPLLVGLTTLTLVVVGITIVYLRQVDHPILDFSLLRLSSFRAALLGGGLLRLSLGATPFLLPIMLQTGFGWAPSNAGLVMLWAASGAIVGRLVAVRIIEWMGFRLLLVVSAALAGMIVMVPGSYTIATPSLFIFSIAMATNMLFTTHYAASNALIFAEVPDGLTNAALTLSVVFQQITQSLGISVGALVLYLSVQNSGGEILPTSFFMPFLVLGSLGLLALPLFLSLPSNVAQNMKKDNN